MLLRRTFIVAVTSPSSWSSSLASRLWGALRTVAQPLRLDGERTAIRRAPPLHGADGTDVLRGAGFDDDEIERLVSAGAVQVAGPAHRQAG